MSNLGLYLLWFALSCGLLLLAWWTLESEEGDLRYLLPGATTSGHYQIELACEACHTGPWSNREMLQETCVGCHGEALETSRDSHPASKFTDPRNADRVAALDARYCVTCHIEHRPDKTSAMGVTLPDDYCVLCHADIAEDRPSHTDMPFDTCASAGCHNFHDNRAIYEDFLVRHGRKPDLLKRRVTDSGNFADIAAMLEDYPQDRFPITPLTRDDVDAPAKYRDDRHIDEWLTSSHARNGVNCTACHAPDDANPFVPKPGVGACESCHQNEVKGFMGGLHGMRQNVEAIGRVLAPMTPAEARLPMHEAAHERDLTCNSCHAAHGYKTDPVETCLSCHADTHSTSFKTSKHFEVWLQELAGDVPTGSGVTCATCHMPRIAVDYNWGEFTHVLVEHNQSDTIRPNEKMIRPVCTTCHGLRFAIDALADPALIENNFAGQPAKHVESIDMAIQRENR